METKVAVIGTAGRDRRPEYSGRLWVRMYQDAIERFDEKKKYTLVSGGAAWADHLAVVMFLTFPEDFSLKLFLPAPFVNGRYEGERASSGSVSNWYHEMFSEKIGFSSLEQISEAIQAGADVEMEPKASGMGAFFARNSKVAAFSDACLAYTWGDGKEPADGGTKDTWTKIGPTKRRVHVPLRRLCGTIQA